MLKSYFKIALRNLRRHPAYTFINVTGLAVGMACCLLIMLFVRDELSYDRHHENADRIVRITSDWGDFSVPATNPPLVRAFKADFPDIPTAQLMPFDGLAQYEEKQFQEDRLFFANPAVFDVLSFPVLRGEAGAALSEPFKAVITPAIAEKYFGEEDPVGKTLLFDNQMEVEVTGVVAPAPENAHFHFDFLVSWASLDALFDYSNSTNWGNNSIYTYLLLPEGQTAAALEAQLPALIERHAGEDWNGATLALQPLTSIHLHSHHNMELAANSNVAYVYVFSIIALFILLVACINFMNLATARSAERAKEVGVRKVVGARRRQLVQQFLAESILLACCALVLAVLLTVVALPAFRALSGKAITLSVLDDGFTLAAFFVVTLLVGIVAGSYPAFVLSGFRPVSVLKGRFQSGARGVLLRKGLVVFQFATSVCLLVGTVVVYSQLDYLRSAGLGFDQEQVLVMPVQGDRSEGTQVAQFPAFKAALLQQPGVEAVTIASEGLPSELLNGSGFMFEGAQEEQGWAVRTVSVGHDFFETLGVEMVAGRAFSEEMPTDSSAFILNETAMNLVLQEAPQLVASAEAAVGMQLQMHGAKGPLVGVVKDFNMATLHEAVEPVIFFFRPGWYDNYLVRVQLGDVSATVAALEKTWQRFYPEWPFAYRFADAAFDAQYRAEERLGQIFSVFAGLAIFIACLGLFGLAAYTAQQRTKEIGVRKVLGASVSQIILLLSKDFAKLVVVALVVATPIAYFALDRWLEDFAYRIDIAWWVFVVAGLGALGVALLTVSYQSVRAALADPVDSLRYE